VTHLADSLRDLGNCLAEVGRLDDAVAAKREAVATIAPFFLRSPASHLQRMVPIAMEYMKSCEAIGVESDVGLLLPIVKALMILRREDRPMDPVTLAAAAVSFVTPYLLDLGKEAAKSAAKESGKSVWDWIKGKLTSPSGAEAVSDAESNPKDQTNAQALQLALTKALKADPDAAKALEDLLKTSGASMSSQTANVLGDFNKVGQASGGSSVNIG
jgi:hypothetical protein